MATLRDLRADLLAADFTADGVTALLGTTGLDALQRDAYGAVDWLLGRNPDGASPLATLIRCFLLARTVPAVDLDAALPNVGTAGLRDLGLVSGGDDVQALLELSPYGETSTDDADEWWLVSDLSEAQRSAQGQAGSLPTSHVLGIGQASLTLANATIRRSVARALDLGTGSGIQALHLSRHCEQIVATDLDPRALDLARQTLTLSDVDNVELRQGNLLEPVAGQRFDLIVSNPPFVITPRRDDVPEFTYRDGGRAGDRLCADLVRGLGDHLTDGGLAQLLGNWEVGGDEAWSDPVARWLDEQSAPLDAWVIMRELLDPIDYALLWVRDGGASGPERDRLLTAWLDDFAARGVTAIGIGLITLRRPAADTRGFRRLEHRPEALPDGLGEHLGAAIEAHDRVDDLLGTRFVVAPDVVEERVHVPGQEDPSVLRLRQAGGFGRTVELDTAIAAVIGACDGELPLGTLFGAVADLLDLDSEQFVTVHSDTVRDLLWAGFLQLAG